MIKSVHFQNFKALRDTMLPLGRFTLLVGPNGSGKSTALQALQAVADPQRVEFHRIVSASVRDAQEAGVQVEVDFDQSRANARLIARWTPASAGHPACEVPPPVTDKLRTELKGIRVFSLDARSVAAPVLLSPDMELAEDGGRLAGVLDRLRDQTPERFEQLNEEMARWLPEFDRILFQTLASNRRSFQLRTRQGRQTISASELSQGTLLSLTLLTLAYLPSPPTIICLEEPDRGIHPRLLRRVQDALYRLCHPEEAGDNRKAAQVIVTTHSPVMLDLYRERLEEVVIASKVEQEVKFERLSDQPNIEETLGDAHLSEVWYTGILGGVPCES
jgi:predicted ATPase